jgi:periplasmic mercuric ion binding protein
MKKLIAPIVFTALLSSCGNPNEVTENFHVYGNCMMCEETIEGSLKKVNGITVGDWDRKTKQMIVTYDSTKIAFAEVKTKIAGVGYDMEDVRAEDAVYDKLHKCCKYKRPN